MLLSQVPVRHLVFMVHGIGQRLEKANLVDDVGDFRHITAGLAERHLTSYQRNRQRVLFIPCQVCLRLAMHMISHLMIWFCSNIKTDIFFFFFYR